MTNTSTVPLVSSPVPMLREISETLEEARKLPEGAAKLFDEIVLPSSTIHEGTMTHRFIPYIVDGKKIKIKKITEWMKNKTQQSKIDSISEDENEVHQIKLENIEEFKANFQRETALPQAMKTLKMHDQDAVVFLGQHNNGSPMIFYYFGTRKDVKTVTDAYNSALSLKKVTEPARGIVKNIIAGGMDIVNKLMPQKK